MPLPTPDLPVVAPPGLEFLLEPPVPPPFVELVGQLFGELVRWVAAWL